ncbi:MAG: SLC13/DASS family transporter [Planctomycetota bacterium]|nr:MAG: SLC13/DASS family transporter [Planctomycetota bacterium]
MDLPRTDAPRSGWRLLLGPALAGVMLLLSPGDEPGVARMAAIAAWMACWWITEAVPIAVTALLPLVLVPLAQIAPVNDVAVNYGRSTIFLFLGGFLIALSLEVSGLHRRLALAIVRRVGSRPSRLVLGFMLATWALSMWNSNTSATMLMLPIVLSVLATAREGEGEGGTTLATAMLLGVAYAANMGGMATLVGTPPNLAFSRLFVQLFPDAPAVSFLQWMLLALPFSIVFLLGGWLLLTRIVFRLPEGELLGGRETVARLCAELGPLRRDELSAGLVFGLTALLWMTGAGLELGPLSLPGWRGALGLEGMVDDAVVAVTMAVLLFVLPSRDRPGEALLTWPMTRDLPWGMLLLFGGGFALAAGFKQSGLSHWAGSRFEVLGDVSPWLVVGLVALLLTFLTELTSNIATAEMMLPILATAASTLGIDPRALMIPATLSASCAFMMPVATPPAAIVYASGQVPIRSMVRAGIWFNLLGVALVMATMAALAGPVLGVDVDTLPTWARSDH